VTVDKVVSVADETFQSDKVSLATLGPVQKEELNLDCLKFN